VRLGSFLGGALTAGLVLLGCGAFNAAAIALSIVALVAAYQRFLG
jgi:hypothetical protein